MRKTLHKQKQNPPHSPFDLVQNGGALVMLVRQLGRRSPSQRGRAHHRVVVGLVVLVPLLVLGDLENEPVQQRHVEEVDVDHRGHDEGEGKGREGDK